MQFAQTPERNIFSKLWRKEQNVSQWTLLNRTFSVAACSGTRETYTSRNFWSQEECSRMAASTRTRCRISMIGRRRARVGRGGSRRARRAINCTWCCLSTGSSTTWSSTRITNSSRPTWWSRHAAPASGTTWTRLYDSRGPTISSAIIGDSLGATTHLGLLFLYATEWFVHFLRYIFHISLPSIVSLRLAFVRDRS